MNPPTPAPPPALVQKVADTVAHVLDRRRVDPLVGLVLPGVGDVACGLVGLGVVALAARYRVAKVTLARMLLNLAIAVSVGAVPIVGDLFDFWFKANTRNARILARSQSRRVDRYRDGLILALACVAVLAALTLPVLAIVVLVRTICARGA